MSYLTASVFLSNGMSVIYTWVVGTADSEELPAVRSKPGPCGGVMRSRPFMFYQQAVSESRC